MATHTDTNKLASYKAGDAPALGNMQRFIATELTKIEKAIGNIIVVMGLFESRMNTNGLT